MALHIPTPLLHAPALSSRLQKNVWLKMEALQPCGSFKLRGVGAVCEARQRTGAQRLVCSSGGNAGIAVAYCARQLGLPVQVVVPQTTSEHAQTLIRAQGAQLTVHGSAWAQANALAQTLVGPHDAFVHPFDDPLLWQGHATMVDEMATTGPKPDLVVLAVGGGGLLCGVLEGLHRNGWADVPVMAAETVGADCYARSLAAARPVDLDTVSSIATSLGARRPCDAAVRWAARHPIHSVVVTDAQAVAAALHFAHAHGVVVESACGAALAALDSNHPALAQARTVAVIVCGGSTNTLDQLQQQARELAGR